MHTTTDVSILPFEVLADFSGRTVVAEIYDDPGVASSLMLMFPDFDYSEYAQMTVDEVLRKARKEIWGGVVSSDRCYILALTKGQRAYAHSLDEAALISLKFINSLSLEPHTWQGGRVTHASRGDCQIAQINFAGDIEVSNDEVIHA